MKALYVNDEKVYKYKQNQNYLISETGKVYSTYVKGAQGRTDLSHPWELSYGHDRDGYLRVVLSENGKKKYIKVHQMMAYQFLDYDPDSNLVVNHIDGNKQNNSISNLELVTVKENTAHAHVNSLCGRDVPVDVEYNGELFSFSCMADCISKFPDLSHNYLNQLRNNKISFMSILFKKEDGLINAYHNGVLINSFKEMQEASFFYGKSRGTVSSAFKYNQYRTKVNQYHVTFPNVSTIEKTQ